MNTGYKHSRQKEAKHHHNNKKKEIMKNREGMAAEKKSNFSLACNLLSKLVKKGSFKELGLDLSPRPQEQAQGEPRQPTTMNLLPRLDVSDTTAGREKTDTDDVAVSTGKPMDLVPQNKEDAEREEDEKKAQLTIFYGGKVLVFDKFPSEKATDLMQFASERSSGNVVELDPTQPCAPPDLPMPIARRASLHRFFAKREDRIVSRAPYPVNDSKKAWLAQEIFN